MQRTSRKCFIVCRIFVFKRTCTVFLMLVAIGAIASYTFVADYHHGPLDRLKHDLVLLKIRLRDLDSKYKGQQEILKYIEDTRFSNSSQHDTKNLSTEVQTVLENLKGWNVESEFRPKESISPMSDYIFQLLPHLMNDPYSLMPSYHLKGNKSTVDFVITLPTVNKSMEHNLLVTIADLINGLSENDYEATLIIVMVVETDLKFASDIVRQLKLMFPLAVKAGLVEVLSANPHYYPEFITPHNKMWRAKENLNTIYLMSYARTRGTFLLMLGDNVVTKKNYLQKIKKYAMDALMNTPDWFLIEFDHVEGIVKLFRTVDMQAFIIYMQLFYDTIPLNCLVDNYLADRVCDLEQTSRKCEEAKQSIRLKYNQPLFKPFTADSLSY